MKKMYNNFWNSGNYHVGNSIISKMMDRKNPTQVSKRTQWSFHCCYKGVNVDVCNKFICNVFCIGKRRVDTIQKKIITNTETVDGLRGKHGNHVIKLTEDVKILIQEHCNSILHFELHYSREDTKLNYFNDKSLTLHVLYISFSDFYASVTGSTSLSLDESTYSKYFNHCINFSFNLPRTDVYDLCYANESNENGKDEYKKRKLQIEEYKKLKKLMLSTITVLHCEFDFRQNLPIPKLPLNAQFFR